MSRAAVPIVVAAMFAGGAVATYGVLAGRGTTHTDDARGSTAGGEQSVAMWHYRKTPAEVQALLGSDRRLVSIAVASASPLLLDVAVIDNTGVGEVNWWWVPETGPDVTGDGIGRFAGSHEARLVSLAPYVIGRETYFAGIYVSAGGPDDHGWWYYFDQPRAAIDGLLASHGARLVDLRSYSKGATLYSVILVPKGEPTDGWWWDTGLDGPAVRARLRAHGAVLTSLSPADPSTSTFDVVMTSTPYRSMPTYDNVSWAWATQEGD